MMDPQTDRCTTCGSVHRAAARRTDQPDVSFDSRVARTLSYALVVAFLLTAGCGPAASGPEPDFPRQPIKIVVYTGPGGLIDTTARKFTEIAKKYTDATFVVENQPGAGGIVALKRVLQMPADGYTLYACTKSNISKIVASRGRSYIESLDWIALLIADPECVITRTDAAVSRWEDVLQDARARPGKQIWVGPDTGGLDHVMALKTWNQFGISGTWVPFKSGGHAKVALLGDQGTVYVGNPREALGNPDLRIAVVSSPERLDQFPNAPIFREFGTDGLDNEFMWRGFAIKRGTVPQKLEWYGNLFRQVTQDSQWRNHWQRGGTQCVYFDSQRFSNVVQRDADEFTRYLTEIGILHSADRSLLARFVDRSGLAGFLVVFLAINWVVVLLVLRTGHRRRIGYFLIPASLVSLCALLLAITLVFPRGSGVGPAAVPQLWIVVLTVLGLGLLFQARREPVARSPGSSGTDLVWKMAALLAAYVLAIFAIGYFPSSFLMLVAAMYLLGVRSLLVTLSVSAGWLLVSYAVFVYTLHVPLPVGRLLQGRF